jgi:hypothetical protein
MPRSMKKVMAADVEDVAGLVGLLVQFLGGEAPEAGPVVEEAADGLVDHEAGWAWM